MKCQHESPIERNTVEMKKKAILVLTVDPAHLLGNHDHPRRPGRPSDPRHDEQIGEAGEVIGIPCQLRLELIQDMRVV